MFALVATFIVLSGCSSFSPVVDETRYYVLKPSSCEPVAATVPNGNAVGLGRIELADYLLPKQIALRTSDGEIRYSANLQWAERLDKGIQRVLTANLTCWLGPRNAVLSTWRRSDVSAELYVSIQRFESDETGKVTLEALWTLMSPATGKIVRASALSIVRQGKPLDGRANAVAETMSESLNDLSHQLATVLLAPGCSSQTNSLHD
jgi:uncharacterized lipoprotein YmbA